MEIQQPGDILATSEELLPGDGTYDDGTHVRAARFGTLQVTPDMEATIKGERSPPQVTKGDIIIGRVSHLRDEFGSVEIIAVRGKEGSMHHKVEATLHVSKASRDYLRTLSEVLAPGDIIRAKVLGLKGGPQLAIDHEDMGVVHAEVDGVVLQRRKDGHLRHPDTGQVYRRKTAKDYGSGHI